MSKVDRLLFFRAYKGRW